jgi:uncharacterized tellurite resistance protein B-like protein
MWKIFGLSPEKARNLGSLFADLDELLVDQSERDVKFIAGFAGLLGRVAMSDSQFTQEESDEVERIIRSKFQFDDGLYQALLSTVRHNIEELRGIEDFRYSQLINEVCGKKEKLDLIYCLFAVAAIDNSIVFEEDKEISLIAKSLNITNREYGEVRISFAGALEVLKGYRKK